MPATDAGFLRQLRATFRIEAEEHLQAMAGALAKLRREGGPADVVEAAFRAAHSLRGAARAVELPAIEAECRHVEEVFAAWKRQRSAPTPEVIDRLQDRLDRIARLLPQEDAPAAPAAAPAVPVAPQRGPAPAAPAAASPGMVRVPVDVLDARLLEAEEMLAVKLAARQQVEALRTLSARVQEWFTGPAAAPPGEALHRLQRRLALLTRVAERERMAVAKQVDELLDNAKKLLLLPFSTLSAGLPRLVRELAREDGKEAELQVEGEDVLLDKRILDALRDPLVHLLRNCIAHGVEPPAERARRGKPVRARVRLSVAQLPGGKVQVCVTDDGAGVDPQRVRDAAVRDGVLTAAEAAQLDDAQAQALVFRSGVSTRASPTGLSGRGLGLPIVQENTARIGGEVTVQSRPGEGTLVCVVVPAIRSTFRGVVVEAGGRRLVLPTLQLERVLRPAEGQLRVVEGRRGVLVDGQLLPVVDLAQVLGIGTPGLPAAPLPTLVLLGPPGQRTAFAVDQVLGEQEMLVKPLHPPLVRVRHVSAASVLDDGQVAFILHVGDLLRSARRTGSVPVAPAAAPQEPARSVLVAEDSITSRTLIKAILEAAGCRVSTAADGIDAYEQLLAGRFDLLVSDVEMPRLNGFELTARVRAHPALAELPVVLLTALESPRDRERGLAAGASAYVVKSSFDQGTLLDAVRRLA